MPSEPLGLLVMAYGSPAALDQVEPYYTHIRRGRPPAPEQLAELVGRYEAIGGVSPLRARTEAQAGAVAAACEATDPGRFELLLGMKHATPFIEDAVAEAAARGLRRVVAVTLAPHYSRGSVGEYLGRAREAGAEHGVEVAGVEHWYDLPEYVAFLTAGVTAALDRLPPSTKVFFTAHSLPLRVLEGDPYPDQLEDGARQVAEASRLAPFAQWGRCWQSAGRTPEPWAGPDILDMIRDLAGTGRAEGVLVVPHGFVADHLEVLYDLDIEARQVAEEAGLTFARTPVLNDDPTVLAALADRVRALADATWGAG